MVSSAQCFWEIMEPLRVDALVKGVIFLGTTERAMGTFLLPAHGEVGSFDPLHVPTTMSRHATGPKAVGPSDHGLKSLRL